MTRVLIVDDQPGFRTQLRRLLTLAGLTVVGEAGDITEAEALVRTTKPELTVLDVMLPGVNGIEGTSQLKAIDPGLRVILISSYRDQADVFKKAAAVVGAERFISKDELELSVVQAWKGIPN